MKMLKTIRSNILPNPRCRVSGALAVAATVALFATQPARADTTNSILASQNAFVNRGAADTVQGVGTTFLTQRINDSNTRLGYLRFDLSSFLSSYTTDDILGARLRLFLESANNGRSDVQLRVYGLQNTNVNGVVDSDWDPATLTWNNQPAKTDAPNDITTSTTTLPNANTTVRLGTSPNFTTVNGDVLVEVSAELNLADLKAFLADDDNEEITFVVHNQAGAGVICRWASLANGTHPGATLELLTLSAPPSQADIVWNGTNSNFGVNGDWDSFSSNWRTNGTEAVYTDDLIVGFDDTAVSNAVNLSATVSPGGILITNDAVDFTFSGFGTISGAGGLFKFGTGTAVIANSGLNDFSGATIVEGGTLQVGDGASAGNLGTGSIANDGTLIFNRADAVAVAAAISGSGSVTKNGSGTLTLSGGNSFSGGLGVNAGAVRFTATTSAGSGTATVNTNGTLICAVASGTQTLPVTLSGGTFGNAAANLTFSGNWTAADDTLSVVQSADPQSPTVSRDIAVTGTLSGSGDFTVINAAGLTATDTANGFRLRGTAASSYSGTITFAQSAKGELQTAVAGPFSPAGEGKLVLTGGTLAGDLTLDGTYADLIVRNNSSGDTVLGNDVEIAGGGWVVFNMIGSAPSGSRATMGNLKIGGGQHLGVYKGATTVPLVLVFPTVTLTGGNAAFAPRIPGFGAAANVHGDIALGDISEQAAGSGIIMAGERTLFLSGNNAYTGSTAVESGTLALTGGASINNSATISIASGATFDVSAVSGGFTLGAGQTLGGNGTVNGAVTADGTLSPGASIGTLNFGSSLSYSATGVADMEIDSTGGVETADLADVAGAVTYGGTLKLSYTGDSLTSGDMFTLFNGSSYAGAFTGLELVNWPSSSLRVSTANLTSDGSIAITANSSPAASDLTLGVALGESVTLLVIGGKNTPTDADGDSMVITGVTAASSGTSGFTATEITYTADGAMGTNTFNYTVTDAFGAADTKIVTVIVYSAQGFNKLAGPTDVGGGQYQLDYLGIPGEDYALDETDSLTPPITWAPIVTNTAAGNGAITFTVTPSNPSGFFRTRHVP